MSELNPQPQPPGPYRVRVHVSAAVAYDLEKMQRITKAVLDKLGCGACHSGRAIDFVVMQDFVVNPKTLDVSEVSLGH